MTNKLVTAQIKFDKEALSNGWVEISQRPSQLHCVWNEFATPP